MKSIIGQTILFLYCLIAVLYMPVDETLIIAFLCALIYTTFNNITESGKQNVISTVLFLAVSLFCPEVLLFAPLIFYNILEYQKYYFGIILFGMCVCFYLKEEVEILALLLLGCLIAGFIQYLIRDDRMLDEKFRRTRDDSTEITLLLKEKNRSLLENQNYEIYAATLKERNRIAREIHDNVGHMLSRAILMVGAMKAVNKDGVMEGPLAQLEDTLNTAMTNVRESVHDLHDDSINLKEVLSSLVRDYTFCPAELEFDMSHSVPREIKYSFISIVKEALNNVTKHSNADKVRIVAREHPGLFQLVIEDNGAITRGDHEERYSGIGVQSMEERVRALEGTMQIQKEEGWRIYITVPKKEEVA